MMRPPTLGAPGVYRGHTPPTRRLTAVRLDACAFVGVAPRGPARLPASEPGWVDHRWEGGVDCRRTVAVPVESWEQYVRLYGGFEGPGLLPYAVASFFEQGGRRAYVARMVHDFGTAEDHRGVATGPVEGLAPDSLAGVRFLARSEGGDADGTRLSLSWTEWPLSLAAAPPDGESVVVDDDSHLVPGATLLGTGTGGSPLLGRVSSLRVHPTDPGRSIVVLEDALASPPATLSVLEATLVVSPTGAPEETFDGLGLTPAHPRWMGRVVAEGSASVRPDPRWEDSALWPTSSNPAPSTSEAVLSRGDVGRVAVGTLAGVAPERDGLWLLARNEGSWGDGLRAQFRLDAALLHPLATLPQGLMLGAGEPMPSGSLIRFSFGPGSGPPVIRRVVAAADVWEEALGRVLRVDLDGSVPADPLTVEVVEGRLTLTEENAGTSSPGTVDRRELHTGLGLDPEHPRWIGKVLALESELVRPDPEWLARPVTPSAAVAQGVVTEGWAFQGGEDRYDDITPEDFFDGDWNPADDEPGQGIHCLAEVSDLALLVAPDLYSPEPLAPVQRVVDSGPTSGPDFEPCRAPFKAPAQAVPTHDLDGLRLVPTVPLDFDTIMALQQRLAAFADQRGDVHALLSVPPGLTHRQVLKWRSRFRSWQAAAYHPWLRVSRVEDGRDLLIRVPPAGAAAGIISAQEEAHGVSHGPANLLVAGVADVADPVTPAQHGVLHQAGVNVLARERDGVRLTGARTLSATSRYRQLSVRRLVTLLVRTLEQQMHWTVFEPNGPRLRRDVRGLVVALLRQLFRGGAFKGRSEEEAFFVRCDDALNPPRVADAGQLVCQVGIAPAEPLEFLVLLLVRGGDGTLRAEE